MPGFRRYLRPNTSLPKRPTPCPSVQPLTRLTYSVSTKIRRLRRLERSKRRCAPRLKLAARWQCQHAPHGRLKHPFSNKCGRGPRRSLARPGGFALCGQSILFCPWAAEIHSWSVMVPDGPNSATGEFRLNKVFWHLPDAGLILALATPEEHSNAVTRLKAEGLWEDIGTVPQR